MKTRETNIAPGYFPNSYLQVPQHRPAAKKLNCKSKLNLCEACAHRFVVPCRSNLSTNRK